MQAPLNVRFETSLKYLFQYVTNLMHKICFTISFYFVPLHVSSTCAHHQEVKLQYTASGIITPIGGRLVHEMHGQQNVKS